jgi:tetratricopeptide (TPR) repeat protein
MTRPKARVVPISPAPGRSRSGRVSRLEPDRSARGDEPTRVAPLDYSPGQSMTAARAPGREPEQPPMAPPSPARASRITCAPSHRTAVGGRYSVRNPENGRTEVVPPLTRAAQTNAASVRAPAFSDADGYFEAAELLLQRGDCRGAVLAAQKGMKLAPPRPAQQALYAWLLYERDGRGEDVHPHVFRHLDQALFRDPSCVDAHCFKGVLLARMGQLEDARAYLLRALALDPGNRPATRALQLLERQSS